MLYFVIPAIAGIPYFQQVMGRLDSSYRRNDDFCESIIIYLMQIDLIRESGKTGLIGSLAH